ncbi:hypothetical protein P3T76_012654 [Phytophthora citrophthora]|uniref:Uncharacterized protein n=1 Tax=Phytophthora citrophthora TaxID=4793 RepID=A0AAD9G548_9STRA|nr:hypothetical protein P3T76_012654 [Phytophthora citrophthora]
MPEPPATAPAARGLQYELQGPDWDVPEPPEDLQRLPPEDLQTILQGPGWEIQQPTAFQPQGPEHERRGRASTSLDSLQTRECSATTARL